MLKKNIKYTDYDGNERSDDFYFNLNKAEITEMNMSYPGGLEVYVKKITDEQDAPKVMSLFKEIIMKAYGERVGGDAKHFVKRDANGNLLAEKFVQTEAYSELFMELLTVEDAATKFMEAIVPKQENGIQTVRN